jgi:hypothetical protein
MIRGKSMKRIMVILISICIITMFVACNDDSTKQQQGASVSSALLFSEAQPNPFTEMLEKMFSKPYSQVTQKDIDRIKGFRLSSSEYTFEDLKYINDNLFSYGINIID